MFTAPEPARRWSCSDECLGCEAAFYRAMQDGIARFTRACAYDRAGVGYSSAAPKPHITRQIVGDLRELLGERDESGRVVLVGHGLGGLMAQLYAREFPSSVAGMVLVDAQTKDSDSRYYGAYPPEALARMKEILGDTPENLDIDDEFRAMDDLRKAPLSLGDRPLVLVSRGKSQPPSFGIAADAWEKLEVVFRGCKRRSRPSRTTPRRSWPRKPGSSRTRRPIASSPQRGRSCPPCEAGSR